MKILSYLLIILMLHVFIQPFFPQNIHHFNTIFLINSRDPNASQLGTADYEIDNSTFIG